MNENIFDKLEFGPFKQLLDNEDITEVSYTNGGQIWVHSLSKGNVRVEVESITATLVEKLALECANLMGTTFNNATPFLEASTSELHLNFVHPSVAMNGIALVIRKTPAKIRIEQDKMINDGYFTKDIHDFLVKCVEAHCNIIVSGEPDSGKTEFVKYLVGKTRPAEKIITIEQKSELNLDKIFPQRNIVAMKTNNIANYEMVLETAMRQNPKWIVLSEIKNAKIVEAIKTAVSSGYNVISTINSDRAFNIPSRLYGLMETKLDIKQFLPTIHRYIQIAVHVKSYHSKETGKIHRELDEVVEFYVDDDNEAHSTIVYKKSLGKNPVMTKPSKYLLEYLENQNIDVSKELENAKENPKPATEKKEAEPLIPKVELEIKEEKKEVPVTSAPTTPATQAPATTAPVTPVAPVQQPTTPPLQQPTYAAQPAYNTGQVPQQQSYPAMQQTYPQQQAYPQTAAYQQTAYQQPQQAYPQQMYPVQ